MNMAEDKTEQSVNDTESKDTQATENAEQTTEQTAPTETKAEDRIAELEKENADLKEQLLRKIADFDNYRKRMIKEKQETLDYANTNLLKDLLDSLDNFDRTIEAAATAKDASSIADGVKMVNKGLVSLLENKYNLTSYGVAGDAFDPEIHEAIGSAQGAVAEPVLNQVYLKGYKLKDRVIRHAKVMVTMPDGSVKAEDTTDTAKTEDK
jgi:molecular chaperone GrpE